MDIDAKRLLEGWSMKSPYWYILFGAVASLFVRLIISILKAFERKDGEEDQKFFERFYSIFTSTSKTAYLRDYWYSFILGWMELCTFPILIKTGNLIVIGGWFALKVLPQWKVWVEERQSFIRYLIACMLITLLSFGMTYLFMLDGVIKPVV